MKVKGWQGEGEEERKGESDLGKKGGRVEEGRRKKGKKEEKSEKKEEKSEKKEEKSQRRTGKRC